VRVDGERNATAIGCLRANMEALSCDLSLKRVEDVCVRSSELSEATEELSEPTAELSEATAEPSALAYGRSAQCDDVCEPLTIVSARPDTAARMHAFLLT